MARIDAIRQISIAEQTYYPLHKRVRRLFENTRTEGGRYFRKYGYCPIMHLFVFPTTTVDREPWLPAAVMAMWEDSKQQALAYLRRLGYGLMLFSQEALEDQRLLLGSAPWAYPPIVKTFRDLLTIW